MEINITIRGDGSVAFVSSSAIGGIQLSASDAYGSGIYLSTPAIYDYKFLLNKSYINIQGSFVSFFAIL